MNQPTLNLHGLAGLAPVTRETAQDKVYSQLRQSLICGGFDAGEVFKAGEIAALMSVSSMPVREALARLVSECALEAMANRRVRVPLLDKEIMQGIFEARKLIEGELAACALANITVEDITTLQALTDQYEAAQDETAIASANHAFHFTIYRRAQSRVLIPFAESLWMQAGPYVRAAARLHSTPLDNNATQHHHGVLRAIKAQDPDALTASLHADISQPFAILERSTEELWGHQERAVDV